MEMASRYTVATNVVTLVFLIQIQVCFLNADENVLELRFEKKNIKVNSSDLTRFRTCLCNTSCTFYHFKSLEQPMKHVDQPGQGPSSYKHFQCGYSLTGNVGGFKCNKTNSSLGSTTGNTVYMHVYCGNRCVEILWVNVTDVKLSSERKLLQGNCTDSNNTRTSTTAVTGGFDSATPGQTASNTSLTQSSTFTIAASSPPPVSTKPIIQHPASNTSLTQSSTSTTAVSSLLPALTTCTHIAIIAGTVSICIVLIILGLVIIIFLRKRKTGKLEQKHATHSLEKSNNVCLLDTQVDNGNPTHSQDNAELQLDPGSPNTGASCSASAVTSNVGGDNDVAGGYASVEECHPTNVYGSLREQPSRTPVTYGTLGNVGKVVHDKTCNTPINSGLITRNQQGANVIDCSTNFELSSANNANINSVHKSNLPSTEHPGYAQAVKKPERKSKKLESATVISDSDYNSSNKNVTSTSADGQQDSSIADVYNIMP